MILFYKPDRWYHHTRNSHSSVCRWCSDFDSRTPFSQRTFCISSWCRQWHRWSHPPFSLNLVQSFNHCGERLFQKISCSLCHFESMSPSPSLPFQNYNEESSLYLMHVKDPVTLQSKSENYEQTSDSNWLLPMLDLIILELMPQNHFPNSWEVPPIESPTWEIRHQSLQLMLCPVLLSSCKNLQLLDASRTCFDSDCLPALGKSLPRLITINLTHTNATIDAVI
jgi:hypothetical protein